MRYEMKKAWRDGTRAVLLEPLDLIARVVAMIPAPGFNMTRYFCVLWSQASLRREVVPEPAAPAPNLLQLDGVYLRQDAATDDGPLSFYPLPTPSRVETTRVASRIADRVEAILKKHGRSLDPREADSDPTELQLDHPALAACYSAAALGVEVSGERAGQPPPAVGAR